MKSGQIRKLELDFKFFTNLWSPSNTESQRFNRF